MNDEEIKNCLNLLIEGIDNINISENEIYISMDCYKEINVTYSFLTKFKELFDWDDFKIEESMREEVGDFKRWSWYTYSFKRIMTVSEQMREDNTFMREDNT